jgi:hypothetical protein
VRLLKASAALVLLFLIVSGKSSADSFDFSPLPFFGGTDLNNTGQIVGTNFSAQTGYTGFIYQNGNLTSFQIPGSSPFSTHAAGINDQGQMVGWYRDQSGTHGFLGVPGAFTPIDVPGQTTTQALAINNAGAITGSYVNAEGSQAAFLYNGAFQTILPGLGDQMAANGINASGEIVGSFLDSEGTQHGFMMGASGKVTILDAPGSFATAALGINDAGMIVGQFATNTDGIFQTHGFLDQGGFFSTIDAPDFAALRFTSAQAINNENQILLNGSTTSYVATFTPIPEPGSAVLFAAGLASFGILLIMRRGWSTPTEQE